jgi:hypothetical protein
MRSTADHYLCQSKVKNISTMQPSKKKATEVAPMPCVLVESNTRALTLCKTRNRLASLEAQTLTIKNR